MPVGTFATQITRSKSGTLYLWHVHINTLSTGRQSRIGNAKKRPCHVYIDTTRHIDASYRMAARLKAFKASKKRDQSVSQFRIDLRRKH